jgi:glycosyltransferase involved in cell wall biosynthesis
MSNYVVHINFKFDHHSEHSGYDVLTKFCKVDKVYNRNGYDYSIKWLFKIKGVGRINLLIKHIGLKIFYKVLHKSMKKNPGIYHFLYPENTLAFFNYDVPEGVKIISSFHQPPETWLSNLQLAPDKASRLFNLSKTSIGVALSKSQLPVLVEQLKNSNFYFIPHGVDTDYFVPPMSLRKNKIILVVGNWLRDFECVRKVADLIYQHDADIKFKIVSNPANRIYFNGSKNIDFSSGITESELLEYYQTAQILFLPLKGAVANNALLEAAACGLPVVCTFHKEMGDYFCNNELIEFDYDKHSSPEFLTKFLLNILPDINFLQMKSDALRKRAEELDWKIIAGEIREVYSNIL